MKHFQAVIVAFIFSVLFALAGFAFSQDKPLPSIPVEDIATQKNPQITTVLTGFKVKIAGKDRVGRATLLKEDWTPTRIEREWVMPTDIKNNRWVIVEGSPRWIEIILIKDGKLKLSEKRLQTKEYKTTAY